VLNSYKLDAGVDVLLKENLTELEQQLARAKDQIAELEVRLKEILLMVLVQSYYFYPPPPRVK